MVRALLEFVLVLLVARSFWRVIGGIMEGLGGSSAPRATQAGPPARGVSMTRDPVCGTFVVPDRAVSLMDGHQRLYFCSTACRDSYRAQSTGRPAQGRTA